MHLFRRLISVDWENYRSLEEGAFSDHKTIKDNFIIATESSGFIGFFVDDELVGYLKLRIMEDYGHLGQIAVKPSEWGKGYGSKMMDFAIEYFKSNRLKKIALYVEKSNDRAISLYKKFGFDFAFESWQYWIEKEQIKKIENSETIKETIVLRTMKLEDYGLIVSTFSEINKEELKTHLKDKYGSLLGESIPLGLFHGNKLKVYGRFNPEFSGSKPFLYTEIEYIDLFLSKLKKYRKKNYLRITFDKNKELASLFQKRGYKLIHDLWVMEKKIED